MSEFGAKVNCAVARCVRIILYCFVSQTPDKLWLSQSDSPIVSQEACEDKPPSGKRATIKRAKKSASVHTISAKDRLRKLTASGISRHLLKSCNGKNMLLCQLCLKEVSTNSSTHLKSKMHLSTLAKESERQSTQYFMTSSMNHFWLNGHSIIAIVCQ